MAILNDIPLGRHKMDIAMKLREVMLINGILYNSEAWHGLTEAHVKTLQSIDEDLLRRVLKAHGKTPLEFLYLETGAVPIKWIFCGHIAPKPNHFSIFIIFHRPAEVIMGGQGGPLAPPGVTRLAGSYTGLLVDEFAYAGHGFAGGHARVCMSHHRLHRTWVRITPHTITHTLSVTPISHTLSLSSHSYH